MSELKEHARANVLGVGVSAIGMEEAVREADALLQRGGRGYICVTGVHGVMEAQGDPEFRRILNRSFITTADGMPTVWVGRQQGHSHMARVYGPDYMLALCQLSAERGYRNFLYGGLPGVAQDLASQLERRFPGLKIVGAYTPPFRPLVAEEEEALRTQLWESRADILWVGLSTPKQERFMAKYISLLPVNLMVGVGAAFDIHSGRAKDAPQWVKRAGLQWLHRLIQEPRRLWRRYLYNNPRFVLLSLLQISGLRKYSWH